MCVCVRVWFGGPTQRTLIVNGWMVSDGACVCVCVHLVVGGYGVCGQTHIYLLSLYFPHLFFSLSLFLEDDDVVDDGDDDVDDGADDMMMTL